MGNQTSATKGDPNAATANLNIRGFAITGNPGLPKKLAGRIDHAIFTEAIQAISRNISNHDPDKAQRIKSLQCQFFCLFFSGFFVVLIGMGCAMGGFIAGGITGDGGLIGLGVFGAVCFVAGIIMFMYAAISS